MSKTKQRWKPRESQKSSGERLNAELEIRQYHPKRVLIVSIDIGKDVNCYYIRQNDLIDIVPPTEIRMNRNGYVEFINVLDSLIASGEYELVLLGNEPTGVYHEPWMHALSQHYAKHQNDQVRPYLRYRLVSSYQVKQERKRLTSRNRKTDPIDTQAIANILSQGNGNDVFMAQIAGRKIQIYYQQISQYVKLMKTQKRQMLNLFDRLWPSALGNKAAFKKAHPKLEPPLHLVDSKVFQRETVRVLFEHCPNPHIIRKMECGEIRAFFHEHNAQCGPKTAQRIMNVARQSVLLPPAQCEVLAASLQKNFAIYRTYEEQTLQHYADAAALLPQTSGEVLLSFPGVSEQMAIQYMAIVLEPGRFPNAAHLWAFSGFDTHLSRSSNSDPTTSISKRGNPLLRHTLYQIGWLATQHHPESRALYQKALQRGKSKRLATIHVAHKVNRILFAMLRDQVPYLPQHQ